MSQEYLSSTISSFFQFHKKKHHHTSYILCLRYISNLFESNRTRKEEREKGKIRPCPSWMAKGGKKKRKRGWGQDFLEDGQSRGHEVRRASPRGVPSFHDAGVPTSVPDERRRISVPRNVVERASSACRRRPIPLLFVSRFTFTRSRHVTGKNLKDDGWIVGSDHVASGKREPVPRI